MCMAHLDVVLLLLMERRHFGKPLQLAEQQLHIWADKINNLSATKLTSSTITSEGGSLGIFCSTLRAYSSVQAGSVYTSLLDCSSSAITVGGYAASWKTATISGTTIRYLGR